MSPFALTLKSMRNRRFTVGLTVLTIALSVALLLGVERLRKEMRTSFTNTISGTDLIVGARSGSVSLLLYSVFHIGNPTQNISHDSYQMIADDPAVAWTIPVSLGDSHRGYRVMGTTDMFFRHYRYAQSRQIAFSEGEAFASTHDAVLGAEVARKLGYQLGQNVIIAHGTGEVSFIEHDDHPFQVTGILEPTGTPVDRTILVTLEGITAMHLGFMEEGHQHGPGCPHDHAISAEEFLLEEIAPADITAVMVRMKSRANALHMQRRINTYDGEPLTAILPGLALQELWSVTAVAENTLMVLSAFVLFVALAGMLTSLMNSLNERRREMAILRSVGARPVHVFALFMCEALGTSLAGTVAGVGLLYGLVVVARPTIESRFGIFIGVGLPSPTEWLLLGIIVGGGMLVGIIPGYRSYRYSLADGLTVRV